MSEWRVFPISTPTEPVAFKRELPPWFEDVAAVLGRRQFDPPARRWLKARRQSADPNLGDPFDEWED